MLDLRVDHGALGLLLQVLQLRHDIGLRVVGIRGSGPGGPGSVIRSVRLQPDHQLKGRLAPALSFFNRPFNLPTPTQRRR